MNPKEFYLSVMSNFGTAFASKVFITNSNKSGTASNGLLWRCCLLYSDWLVLTLNTSTEFQISENVSIICFFFLDTKSC